MIISHKHRFIFIKVPKTAGTSMEIKLSEVCGEEDVITKETTPDVKDLTTKTPQHYRGLFNPIPDLVSGDARDIPKNLARFVLGWKYYDHIAAGSIKGRVGDDIWNSYYKFCFERNPWDKVVSTFNWGKRLPGREQDFRNYVEQKMFSSDYRLYSLGDKAAVDFIGKFENLEDDLQTVYDRLGLAWEEKLPVTKAHTRKRSDNYRKYYDASLKEIVANEFRREVDLFGYKF